MILVTRDENDETARRNRITVETEIVGARVLLQDGTLAETEVTMGEGRVVSIGKEPAGAVRRWNATGLLLLPGMIDLHGDAFERQLMPRPGVRFPDEIALLETDRQMLANGITTAYHGLTYSWEPGLRDAHSARRFVAKLHEMRPRLACDTRLHLRLETFNLDAEPEVLGWIADGLVDLFAFNDHTDDIAAKLGDHNKLSTYAARTGLSATEFAALLAAVKGRAGEVPGSMQRLAQAARRRGVPMASHDDMTPAVQAAYQALGCRICEFPFDRKTARAALDSGAYTVLGAPNVVRGGSHAARLGGREAVAESLCSVLTSDYYYPALMAAAFTLVDLEHIDLTGAWNLVSANAADAVGLADRGRIAPGQRADLVMVDWQPGRAPRVIATFIAGEAVFTAENPLRMIA
ncbi:alpha-D-ribose 1-methylphosphonate 5-triphosphate diphosphatase [Dongia sedimenti]|uniref:Alpha-D-ribose 1-methylphosphonate 5-triphosphate diphosphatase n=1 Tax=Dongia sedimenti TaxID=3064282 RepID=A0ABU0YTS8_9PROT|nr:alpha-D-ribose 1-methylphosphonate 5-triphosphate diphosphatase [Rhodospirillaceae bacterium R-7]